MMKTAPETTGGASENKTTELSDADLSQTDGGGGPVVTSYQLGVLDNDAAPAERTRGANADVAPMDQISINFAKIEYE